MSALAPAGSPPPISGAGASPPSGTATAPAPVAVAQSPVLPASPPTLPPTLGAVPPGAPSSPPAQSAIPPTNAFSSPPAPSAVPPAVPPAVGTSPPSPPAPSSPKVSHPQPNAPPPPHTTTASLPHTNGTVASPSSSSSFSHQTELLIGIAAGGLLAVLFLSILMYCCLRKKKTRNNHSVGTGKWLPYMSARDAGAHKAGGNDYAADLYASPSNPQSDYNVATVAGSSAGKTPLLPQSSQTVGNSTSYFDYEELYTATNGFSPSTILGEGGFGRVYKGQLLSGKAVAVKQLTVGGGQGDREFRAEVEIISRVHHRHLVSLVGYCIVGSQRLLVYDFVPNGTLADNLHGKKRGLVMDWATRLRVALGSARGLAYLHEDCHPRIIHRDIKASNILLDNNFEAQVADFGLAKAESDAHTHVTTRVMGTFGYLAPEYAASGKLTEKSDVFSFGVVLLELITGRKPVDTRRPPGEDSLVEWAHPLMKLALEDGNVEQLVDPELGNDYDKNEMFRMIEAAAACVCYTASKRPKMSQVVRALESDTENAGLHQGLKPGQSFEHDSNLGGSHFGRGSSDYDTQQYNADMQQFQKLALESLQLGSAYTSNTAGAFNGSMANPPSIELGSNFSSGEAQFDAREQRPISVRTKTSGAVRGPPIGTSRLANIATGGVQWNFLPRPRYQRQLSSGSSAESSVKSGSIRSDLMTLTPPAPQGYSFGSNWSSEASSVKSGSIKSDLLMRPPPPMPLDYSTGSANYSGEDDDTQFHTAHKADSKPN
ncbi:hypothetical protein CY35_09G036800 [Sphagnum magellanicum]|nr:hypothetical protein CY35_09G036800 [Sphagnum magellanicum]